MLVLPFRKKKLKSSIILVTNITSVALVAFLLFKKAGMPHFKTYSVSEKIEDLTSRRFCKLLWGRRGAMALWTRLVIKRSWVQIPVMA